LSVLAFPEIGLSPFFTPSLFFPDLIALSQFALYCPPVLLLHPSRNSPTARNRSRTIPMASGTLQRREAPAKRGAITLAREREREFSNLVLFLQIHHMVKNGCNFRGGSPQSVVD